MDEQILLRLMRNVKSSHHGSLSREVIRLISCLDLHMACRKSMLLVLPNDIIGRICDYMDAHTIISFTAALSHSTTRTNMQLMYPTLMYNFRMTSSYHNVVSTIRVLTTWAAERFVGERTARVFAVLADFSGISPHSRNTCVALAWTESRIYLDTSPFGRVRDTKLNVDWREVRRIVEQKMQQHVGGVRLTIHSHARTVLVGSSRHTTEVRYDDFEHVICTAPIAWAQAHVDIGVGTGRCRR